MTRRGRQAKRTPKAKEPQANVVPQDARRTLIAQLMAEGIYQPKAILEELAKRPGYGIGRTQLYSDMAALDAEQEFDFREHRKRFRRTVFNRYLRRERDAEQSIADIRADEAHNYSLLSAWRAQIKAERESGDRELSVRPKTLPIDYGAKARLLTVSMDALEKASAIAGIATMIVGSESGDLASWAQALRGGGRDEFQKRRARVFPEYEKARRQRSARGRPGG